MVRDRLQGGRRLVLGRAVLAADAARTTGSPATGKQAVWELRLSHWSGALPELTVNLNWAYRKYHHIFGSFTYLGQARPRLQVDPGGDPLDTFGRNLYLDTFDSAYGEGWKRENSFLMHKGTGKFCYGFYSHGARPVGSGRRATARRSSAPASRRTSTGSRTRSARTTRSSTCSCTRCRRSSSPATRSARPSSLLSYDRRRGERRRAARGDAAPPGRGRRRHRRPRGRAARADGRLARLARARAAARRRSRSRPGGAARAAAGGGRLRRLAARRRPGRARAALRPRRAADRALARHRGAGGTRAGRCSRARSAGSSASSQAEHEAGDHTLFVGRVERAEPGADGAALDAARRRLPPRDRGGRLRPRRRDRRHRAGVGRGARGARARARRPLARGRAGRHDGHELARVVALHARRARARGAAGGDQRRGRPADARALPRTSCR